MKWNDLETFTFGDNPSLADDLAALVLAGRKRATCWAARDGKLTEVGKRTVMLDGGGPAMSRVRDSRIGAAAVRRC